ncbi:MAG: hypothetical protein AB1500_03995 [Bacillota bacterium]
MFGFNPFGKAGVDAARRKISNIRKEYPELDREELAWMVIKEKCLLCALAGCFTAIPAIMPGLGTLIAILGGAAIDISVLGMAITRLVLELATLYGRDTRSPAAQREALLAFTLAVGIHGINKRLTTLVAAQFSKQLTNEILERILINLGLRASQRQLIPRLLPLIGVLAAGAINYFFARAIGARLLRYYQKGDTSFEGQTIDAEFTAGRIE